MMGFKKLLWLMLITIATIQAENNLFYGTAKQLLAFVGGASMGFFLINTGYYLSINAREWYHQEFINNNKISANTKKLSWFYEYVCTPGLHTNKETLQKNIALGLCGVVTSGGLFLLCAKKT